MKKITCLFILFFCFQFLNAQNTCGTALSISGGSFQIPIIDGTDIPSPVCTDNGTGATAGEWYKYSPTQNYTVTVTTELQINSGNDTRFHVFTGTCGNLICYSGDDDAGNIGTGYLSIATFNVFSGTTYFIAFDNKWRTGAQVPFEFQLIEQPFVLPAISFNAVTIPSTSQICCVADMNNDYLDDIVTVETNQMTMHTQKNIGGFTTTVFPLPALTANPGWSIAAADFDRNGYTDLVFGSSSRLAVIKANSSGTGYTEISYPQSIFTQRTNFVDINNDGKLDLWACHDVAQSHAYRNDGAGNLNFDISLMPTLAVGGNYQSMWTDYDNDGDFDMYLSKCRAGAPVGDAQRINLLYKNNGNGTFSEVGAQAGVNDGSQSWSAAIEDFDNDGDMDILLSNISDTNKFYKNNGDGTFTDIYATTGIDPQVGSWELQTADFNNDGFVDFIWANNKQIYLNNGDLTFTGYLFPFSEGGIGDLNNDGFLDVQFNNTVYYNVPNANNWVKINLKGIQSNRNGIGARVEIYGTWGKQIREIRSGHGFSHMSSLNAYFGIGTATAITKVIIKWPSGVIDTVYSPAINQALLIEESSTLSVNENSVNNFVLYPNPTKDFLKVNFKTNEIVQTSVSIFDMNGKLVLKTNVENEMISVKILQTGTYSIIFENELGKKYSSKFIKE
jgi:hypothetical protein